MASGKMLSSPRLFIGLTLQQKGKIMVEKFWLGMAIIFIRGWQPESR
jgi:hypothetical protein